MDGYKRKQFWMDLAELVDAFRMWPRMFMVTYLAGIGHIVIWATKLPDISSQQAAFISVVAGTFPLVLNFYMNTGRKWQKETP